MFLIIYAFLFFIFVLLGFFIGRKYQQYSAYEVVPPPIEDVSPTPLPPPPLSIQFPPHVLDTIDFTHQYDKIVKVYNSIQGIGIKNNEKIDIIICKKEAHLSPEEQHIEQLINNNQIYFKILLIEE